MDIPRPSQAKQKRRRRILFGAGGVLLLVLATWLISTLKPAAPSVDRSSVWIDTVKRGEFLRQVRGIGTLVPDEIRWLAARTQGRVDRIILRPGAVVEPDSVILVLTNPDVEQAAIAADSQWKAASAELESLRVTLERGVLEAESAAATAKANFEQARLHAQVNEQLSKDGLVSPLDLQLSQVSAEQARTLNEIEQKRFAFARDSTAPQLAVKQAEVDRLRAQAELRHQEADALQVRAGMKGVLSALPVEVGQQVEPGANLARVADPKKLKAEVKISETQARDILIGQLAHIDTRNGVVDGQVSRIDPAVQNGTVTVDVTITGELPKGARPDLSVDGVIELERLTDAVHVGRPVSGQENTVVNVFKLDPEGTYAVRTPVHLGKMSVNEVEITSGLVPGDKVIVSDMSPWDEYNRIKLK
jgi:HlyD family secretion protein